MSKTLSLVFFLTLFVVIFVSPFILFSLNNANLQFLENIFAKKLILVAIDVLLFIALFQIVAFLFLPSALSIVRSGFLLCCGVAGLGGIGTIFGVSHVPLATDGSFNIVASSAGWPTIVTILGSVYGAYRFSESYTNLKRPENKDWAAKF